MYISMIGNKYTKHAYPQEYLRLSWEDKESYNESISKQYQANKNKGDSRRTQRAAEQCPDEETEEEEVKNTRQREAKRKEKERSSGEDSEVDIE